uniref:Replication factor C subunit 4 n=1 Tax=Cajanus cajan TaxID=3821 RepID=A0A151TSF2_CAJCA|nr:Replication factor C subunit 4 [Cajanus cajan]
MAPVLQSSQPWVEKYRPKQVKDVAHQDEVVRVLTNTLETGNLVLQCPHMLFYGPPGTGKTTTALAIAHQLFGPEFYKSRVLELNASDDRGINVVRTKIKDFAAVAVGTNQRKRIIEPLASRCAKFRFKPLSEEIMSSRISYICKEEGLFLDAEALSTLSSISHGDLRRAITYLQSAARLFGSSISSENLISVSGVIPAKAVEALLKACKSGNFDLANKEVNNFVAEGYPASQMLTQLLEAIVEENDISDEQKARISKKLGEADKFITLLLLLLLLFSVGIVTCLVDGADEYLQLLDVVSNAMKAFSNMPEGFAYES